MALLSATTSRMSMRATRRASAANTARSSNGIASPFSVPGRIPVSALVAANGSIGLSSICGHLVRRGCPKRFREQGWRDTRGAQRVFGPLRHGCDRTTRGHICAAGGPRHQNAHLPLAQRSEIR